jgi:hypothetical protein
MEDRTDAEPTDDAPAPRPLKRRRWAFALLAAGGLTAGYFFLPHLPRERHIDLRLQDSPDVTAVDVTWSRAVADGDEGRKEEPLRTASFRFSLGTAPENIKYTVQLPNGSYHVDLVVQRGDRAASQERTVTLDDADQITLPLR